MNALPSSAFGPRAEAPSAVLRARDRVLATLLVVEALLVGIASAAFGMRWAVPAAPGVTLLSVWMLAAGIGLWRGPRRAAS